MILCLFANTLSHGRRSATDPDAAVRRKTLNDRVRACRKRKQERKQWCRNDMETKYANVIIELEMMKATVATLQRTDIEKMIDDIKSELRDFESSVLAGWDL
jgi:hypothetical protein